MGKGASSGGKAYDYFGTIGMAIGIGPIASISKIVDDNATIWDGPLAKGGSDADAISIADRGTMRLHWGTPTQAVNSRLNTYETHPPYKSIAYLVGEDFKFGLERETTNTFKVVASRAAAQSIITGAPAQLDANGQANLMAIASEVVTSANGLRIPASRISTATWQAVANSLDAERSLYAVSPLITSQVAARQFFEQVFSLPGVFIRNDAAYDKIEAGRWAPPADLSGLPVITEANWVESPELDSSDMDDLPTDYTYTFTDSARLFKRVPGSLPDLAAIRMDQQLKTENLDMPEVMFADQAKRRTAEYQRQRRGGSLSGSVIVRRSVGRSIRVGDYIRLDVDTIPGGAGSLMLMRVLGVDIDETGPVSLSFVSEPAAAPVAFVNPPAVPALIEPVLRPISYQRPFSLHPTPGARPHISILAARSDDTVVGFELMYDRDQAGGTFPAIGQTHSFALPVSLPASVSAGATTIQVKTFAAFGNGARADRDRWLLSDGAGATDREAADDTLILVLLKKNVSTGALLQIGPENHLEVCSIKSIALASADTWNLGVLRGRQGTSARDFTGTSFPDAFANYEGWIVRRSNLAQFEHADFLPLLSADLPAWFRTRAYSNSVQYSPEAAYDAGLQASNAWTDWAYHWPTGDDVVETQYGSDATNWHATYVDATDIYMRTMQLDGSWGTAVRVRGANGTNGAQGPQGVPGLNGTNGTPGAAGANGQTSYFHVAYANSADGASGFNQTSGLYIGTYVDYTATDSSSHTSYTWRVFRGADGANGTNGIPGTNGANGQTTYLHIKYSDDNGANFTAGSGETPGKYIGQYTDYTLADSNSVSSYTWALIKGQDGANGADGIPATTNLLQYTQFENALAGWTMWGGPGGGISNSRGIEEPSLNGTPVAGSKMGYVQVDGTPPSPTIIVHNIDTLVQATPGKRYQISAIMAGLRCSQCYIVGVFSNSTGGYITEFHSAHDSANANLADSSTVRSLAALYAFAVAPAGATFLTLQFRFEVPSGVTNPRGYVYRPLAGDAAVSQSLPSPWSAGAMTPKGVVGPVGTTQGNGGSYTNSNENQTVSFVADPQRPALIKASCQVAVNLGSASNFTMRLKRGGTTIASITTSTAVAQYATPPKLEVELLDTQTSSQTYTVTIQSPSANYQHAVSQITIL